MEKIKQPKTMVEYYEELARVAREREPQVRAEQRKAEQEFRAACDKDTAGTLLNFMAFARAQFEAIQSQLDAAFPIGALTRAIDAVAAQLAEMDRRLGAIEKKRGAE